MLSRERSSAEGRSLQEGVSDVNPGAEDLTQFAWVPPTEQGLLALARGDWPQVRRDPGAVLFLLRLPSISQLDPTLVSLPEITASAEALECALLQLERDGPFTLIDWSDPRRAPVHAFAVACASRAQQLASLTGACDPERAWAAGL